MIAALVAAQLGCGAASAACSQVAAPEPAAADVAPRASDDAAADAAALAAEAEAFLDAGDYAAARRAWQRAQELSPRPPYLWGIAQAARLGGDCEAALPLYDEFLASLPEVPEKTARAVRVNVEFCQEALARQPESPRPEPTPPEDTTPAPTPSPRPVAPPPRDAAPAWYASPAGGTLLGLGVAAGIASGVIGGASAGQRRAAERAATEHLYGRQFDRADRLRTSAWITGSVAAGLVVSAVVVYAVAARKR